MTVVELFAKLGLKVDDASFKKGESAIGGMRTMLGAVGLSVAAVRGAVEALVASTAAHGNAAEKAAQRVGVSVQALQELTEAADDVQIASGSVESGLKFVGKNAYEAAHGNKEAAKGFNTLGVSVKDASGKLKTADVLMMELADGFAGVADADKPVLAMKLFGKAGGELIPLLNKGSEGIAEMRAEAVSLGLVMDADGVAASVAYTQALDGLEDSLKGLKLSIGGSLLKGSTEMLNTMAAWVRENRALIATRVKEFVDRLGAAISKVKKILDPFISAVKWLISQTWLWKIALGVVIAMLAIQFGAAVQAAVKELKTMLVTVRSITAAQVAGAAAAAATALLWAAGIALVLLAIEELYGWFTGDRETLLGRWLGSFDEFAEKNAFGRMLKSWVETLKELKGFMEDDNTFTNWVRGTVASGQYVGAAMASPFSERAREARKGYGKEAGFFFGREFLTPQGQEAMGAPTSYPGSTSSGGGVKVQIGDVHVGASLPDGLSPGEFVRRLGSEVVTQSDLTNMFNVTHEAVAR